MTQSYNSNPNPHKVPRRVRKAIYLYGLEYNWILHLVRTELKVHRKLRERAEPNTTKWAAANSAVVQCEAVLERLKKGKIEIIKEQG